jgi:predicted nuclease of predicted toxin-antitoxin system
VTKYLLDANLSPKVAKFLAIEFGFDVISLRREGKSELRDGEVMKLATSLRRGLITLDRDFALFSHHFGRATIGVVYLDLPNPLRNVPDINRILSTFFRIHARGVDLEHSLIIITENEVQVRRWQ